VDRASGFESLRTLCLLAAGVVIAASGALILLHGPNAGTIAGSLLVTAASFLLGAFAISVSFRSPRPRA
jgi:hypothetical protein